MVPLKYRTIEWGSRLYLCVADDCELQEFCRMALTPICPSKPDVMFAIFVRESDRGKPQLGLPGLPLRVWAKFLVDKLLFAGRH